MTVHWVCTALCFDTKCLTFVFMYAGWIQAGGADIVLHLLGSANAKLFSRTCRFLSTLLQNHIPVQKAVFVSPLGAVLFQCLAQARDTSGDFLSDTFKTHTSDLSATTTQVESPSEMPAAAGASAEHVSWRQANSAAATTTALSADDAAAATSTVLSQWGSLSIDQIDELTCLLSAVSCLTRAADSVESFFVRSSGVQVLAGILCSARPSDAKHLKLCRRTCVFLKALLMASTLRARVAQELLEAPRLLEALGGILTACLEGQQVTEIDLLENALFILQHLAVHAAVSGSERSARPVAPEALTQALVSLRDCLPTDSQSHRQIAAIQKALATAFPQS